MTGAAFLLNQDVIVGQVLELQIALPRPLRRYDLDSPAYRVFAIVRHVSTGSPPRKVGVMFHGQAPPAGFAMNPTASFLMENLQADVRRFRRHTIMLTARLRVPALAREEMTITEDLSAGGARVLTTLKVSDGDTVEIEIDGGAVRTRARIQHVVPAKGGARRLSLSFLDDAGDAVRALLKRQGL